MIGRAGALALGLVFLCSVPAAARGAGGEAAEKARIGKVIRTSIEWAMTKDTVASYACFAQDSNLFFFNPDKSTTEGWRSFKETTETFFMDPKFKAEHSAFNDLRIHLSKSGDVAWFSCLLIDHNTYDGRPANWDDVRWTGVLEKREGKWVIVQMHFSRRKKTWMRWPGAAGASRPGVARISGRSHRVRRRCCSRPAWSAAPGASGAWRSPRTAGRSTSTSWPDPSPRSW
jgi:ketosteroid isomerase-like protein